MKEQRVTLSCPYIRTNAVHITIVEDGDIRRIDDARAVLMLRQGLIVKINNLQPHFSVSELSEGQKKELVGIGNPLPHFGFEISAERNLSRLRVFNTLH